MMTEETENVGFNGFTDTDEEALESLFNRNYDDKPTAEEQQQTITESGDEEVEQEEAVAEEVTEEVTPEQQPPEKEPEVPDFLKDLPEEHREKVATRLRELEESAKKQEMATKAAVGRAAFLQSQWNKFENQIQRGGDNPKRFRLKPLSDTPEWSAFKESDPVAAQAYEAQMKSYLATLEEQLEEYTAPLVEMTAAQERQMREQQTQQVYALYEADPDWEAKMSQRANTDLSYANWIEYMDQTYPGFKNHANTVQFAYGNDSTGPGMVDIWLEYERQYNAKMQERMTLQQQQQAQMQEGSRLAQQRFNKQETAPPAKPQSPPVQPSRSAKEFDPEEELERLMVEDYKRRGGVTRR